MAVKDLKYALLYDVYGGLLSEKQGYALEMYYCDDLSLAEIAEHIGITRQGVRDQIKHAEEELDRFESKLGLAKKTNDLRDLLEEMSTTVKQDESLLKSLIERARTLIEN